MAETKRRPWFKFHGFDWRNDPRLRRCSREARSLWIDLLTIMHEATPYGHLLIDGKPPSLAQLRAELGDDVRKISRLISELDANQVFSRTQDNVIYSRRMIRDELKRTEAEKYGQLALEGGGSPPRVAHRAPTRATPQATPPGDPGGSSRARATSETQRSKNPPPPAASDSLPRPSLGEPSDAAKRLCELFLERKRNLWPDDPSPPPSLQNQTFIAGKWLELASGDETVVANAIDGAMAYAANQGDRVPRSFGGIDLSVRSAIAKRKPGTAAAATPDAASRVPERIANAVHRAQTEAIRQLPMWTVKLENSLRLKAMEALQRAVVTALTANERDEAGATAAGVKAHQARIPAELHPKPPPAPRPAEPATAAAGARP